LNSYLCFFGNNCIALVITLCSVGRNDSLKLILDGVQGSQPAFFVLLGHFFFACDGRRCSVVLPERGRSIKLWNQFYLVALTTCVAAERADV